MLTLTITRPTLGIDRFPSFLAEDDSRRGRDLFSIDSVKNDSGVIGQKGGEIRSIYRNVQAAQSTPIGDWYTRKLRSDWSQFNFTLTWAPAIQIVAGHDARLNIC